MRHLLMDPAFPDLVAEWAEIETHCGPANDNNGEAEGDRFAEIFLLEIALRDIDASRVW